MKKLSVILTLLLPLTAFASCSDSNEPEVSDNPASSELGGDTKTLVAYFSAGRAYSSSCRGDKPRNRV